MLSLHNPSLPTQGINRMRVLPKLTIDKILLLSVLLSVVYLILYGTMPPDNKKMVTRRRGSVRPGEAFLSDSSSDAMPSYPDDVHKKTSNIQQPFSHGIRYPDILGYPVDGTNTATCSSQARVRALRDRCKTSDARTFDYGHGDKQALRYVVVDHQRKLFYCLIGKAGSKSWLQYMVDSKDTDEKGHLRHNEFLQKIGLEMFRNMPMDKANNQFKDYFKFLVVRHPLQRTVSAYYETVVFHEKYKNKKGALLNFTEFAQRVTNDEDLMDENPHWRRYINRCKVCKLDYDYVVKTETMDTDINDFNRVTGNAKGPTVDFTHQNQFLDENQQEVPKSAHHYKYDKILYILQRKHPELMKKLLNLYGDDMQLFGYKWDWRRGKSSCGANYNGKECC